MSHIVTIRTQIRDPVALAAACARLGLAAPVQGEAELYSAKATGWIVNLPGWNYPAVIDPLTGIEDHAVVECCPGLGDRLVSGGVRPTRLVLRLSDGAVVERAEGEKVELSDAQAADLAALLLAVQAHGHRPQDVEWAIDDEGRLWVLQSRPVTAINWRSSR